MFDEKDKNRLDSMKWKILLAEKNNLKSPSSDNEMVEKIRKIIIDESKKIDGGIRNVD